jgi:hypothetical protein
VFLVSQDEIAVLLGVPNINYPEVEKDAIEDFFQRRDDKLLEGLETVEALRKHATTLAASDDPKRAFAPSSRYFQAVSKAARSADHIARVIPEPIMAKYNDTHDHCIASHIRSALQLPDNLAESQVEQLTRCPAAGAAGVRSLCIVAKPARLATLTATHAPVREVLNL